LLVVFFDSVKERKMHDCFLKAAEKRRSIYSIGRPLGLGENELLQKIEQAVVCAPSAFNSQSARIGVLLGENHQKLWQIVSATLQKITPAEKWPATAEKMRAFAAGCGTILFFEDVNITKDMQQKFPLYQENLAVWAEHGNAMLQYILWTLLAENQIGASLQHYNPLIDEDVRQTWHFPENWRLVAQMPFGSIMAPAGEKSVVPVSERIKVFR